MTHKANVSIIISIGLEGNENIYLPSKEDRRSCRKMVNKRILGVLALCLSLLVFTPLTSNAAENSEGGQWAVEQQGKKYVNADGTNPVNRWWLIQGTWYLFDGNGYATTGWQKHNDVWYYMDANGMMKLGWLNDGGTWYHLSPSGQMSTGWVRDGNYWYYMNLSGAMQTGWTKAENNRWYFLNDSGQMTIGNKIQDGSIYKFETSGELKTVYIDDSDDDPIGSYYVHTYGENEQAFLDLINENRAENNRNALVVDDRLNEVAAYRLDMALKYSYDTRNKSITGIGTLKEYLKSIHYLTNRTCAEVYIRPSSSRHSLDDALSRFENDSANSNIAKNAFENTTYSRIGIATEIVTQSNGNEWLYVMIVLVK